MKVHKDRCKLKNTRLASAEDFNKDERKEYELPDAGFVVIETIECYCDEKTNTPKKYYWTSVLGNTIYQSKEKGKLEEDVVYQDENIIVEHNEDNETYVSYKSGKKG